MVERWSSVLFMAAALSVSGCPRDRDSGNGAPPTPASTVSPFGSNAGDVTRFQDEQPLGPDGTIAKDNTAVRKSPGTGGVVATLPKGTEVIKISTHGTEALITFDDPKDSNERLMGWVPETAVDESAPPSSPNAPLPPLTGEGGASTDDGGSYDGASPPSPPDPNPSNPSHHHHHHPRPHQ
jgi:hypothetical protein